MYPKPTLIYTAGTYGGIFQRVVNKDNPLVAEVYHNTQGKCEVLNPSPDNHHLLSEDEIDGPIIKITYNDSNISLINRNKWTKLAEHLPEQADMTFKKNPNSQLYVMAIHVCDLLGDNNFKKLTKENTVEFKFDYFIGELNVWKNQFKMVMDFLKADFEDANLTAHYDAFKKGQEKIWKKHLENNDDIARSYSIGKRYFSLYNNNYVEDYFDRLIGGKNGR